MATTSDLTTGELQSVLVALRAAEADSAPDLAEELRHRRRVIRAELDRRGVTT